MLLLAGHRVLIAEDDAHLRMLLRTVVESAGAEVVEVRDGREALNMLDLEWFDLIITDLGMPRVPGEQLVHDIRERWGDRVPIVVCSAWANRMHGPALEHLVDATVSKPFAPLELLHAITAAIARRTASGVQLPLAS